LKTDGAGERSGDQGQGGVGMKFPEVEAISLSAFLMEASYAELYECIFKKYCVYAVRVNLLSPYKTPDFCKYQECCRSWLGFR